GGEDGVVESLTERRERRAFECRLTPDLALQTLAEADAFLRRRGLLTRTTDCALPSLYEACHEDPYQPGSPGFGTWPATKWPWFGELAERGYLVAAVHRGKNLIVTGGVARMPDPIRRAERPRGARAHARGRPRLGPPAGSSRRRGTVQRRRPAHRARAEAAGAEVAAGAAGAVRRGRLAFAGDDRRPGSHAFERAGALGPGLPRQRRERRGSRQRAQGAGRRRRARGGCRTRTRTAALVLLAVVLDRHARRRPRP